MSRTIHDPGPSSGDNEYASADDDCDPVLREMRDRLFVRGDLDTRITWGRELVELAELNYGAQADRQLEGVLGLPPYRYHNTPIPTRPLAPFEGLRPVLAGRPDVHQPEPSRMTYLAPVARALCLTAADVFYDIGSGLGKAALFFGAFTPVRLVTGVEIEPAYARFAAARARALGLSHVRFINADALEVDLTPASVFYFYEPFSSTSARDSIGMLADRLVEAGRRKRIRIAVKGTALQQLLSDSMVFTHEVVTKNPVVWMVFESR